MFCSGIEIPGCQPEYQKYAENRASKMKQELAGDEKPEKCFQKLFRFEVDKDNN